MSSAKPMGKPSGRLRRLQWTAATFCAVEIALLAIDRGTISIGNVKIRQEFGLTGAAIGGLISAWSITYALSQFGVGYLIDRFGPRRVLGFALCLWSLAQGAGGFAVSYVQLMLSRIVLGAGEAPAAPTAVRVVGTWYQPEERGMPTALYSAATTLGPAIAQPILTGIMVASDWRVMFMVAGLTGLVAAAGWFTFYRDVNEVDLQTLPAEDRAYMSAIDNEPATTVSVRQWARLFRCRSVIGLALGSFGIGYMFWLYIGWLPAFLETTYHLSIQKTGLVSAIPWMGGVASAACSGYLSDRMAKRGVDPMLARKIPACVGLVGMSLFTASAAQAADVPLALGCIFMVIFFGVFETVGMWSLVTIVAPRAYLGSTASIANLGTYIGATCSPIITGFLLDSTGSFDAALFTGSAVGIVCSGFFIFVIKRPVLLSDLEPADLPLALEAR